MLYSRVKRKVLQRTKGIKFSGYQFATFFTTGLPYGLILDNAIPCSHVLRDIDCGVFISRNLIEERDPLVFESALLFSPQSFHSEETDHIRQAPEDNNFTVKALLGNEATVENLSNYGAFFPFDVLHICAHGGETDGYSTTLEFTDRQKLQHKCDFYEIVGIGASDGEKVMVTRKIIFKSFDGFPWMSSPLKRFPRYVFDDMMKAIKSDESDRLVRVRVDHPIALSCHIQCHGSIHQGNFQSLAGFGHPLVFNNTCSSSHELAVNFIDASARSYIGTLWSIGNETASHAAIAFCSEALRQGNILAAFFAMNRSITNPKHRNIYILWGLHLSSLRKPQHKSDDKIFGALLDSYFKWVRKIETNPDPDIKRNSIPIAKFLLKEVVENFSPARLKKFQNFDPQAIEEFERLSPAIAEDDFSRGVHELDVGTQQSQKDELQ